MAVKPITVRLDPLLVRTGLRRVLVRGLEPVMAIAKPHSLKFMAVSANGRLLLAWEHPIAGPPVKQYFLFPPLMVSFLSSDLARSLTQVDLSTVPPGRVVMTVTDAHGSYEMRWRADPNTFGTPAEFSYMLAPPRAMIDVGYLEVNDAAHRAVAKLLSMETADAVPRNKLAILVDFAPSRLSIDGQTVELGIKGRYFFDPRLIIRALDSIHADSVRVGLTRLPAGNRAVLAFLAEEDGWNLHCALLSIGVDTQHLYPIPDVLPASV